MYLTQRQFENMGGAEMDDVIYNRYAAHADAVIDRMTHGRIKDEETVRSNVQYAAFDLITAMVSDSANNGHEVASVSNDGVSVTYASGAATSPQRRYANIVRDYLENEEIDGVSILYAGVDD